MDHPRIDCPRHGDQPSYVTRNNAAYCPLCLIQGHAEHIKERTGVEGHPRILDPPEDYSRGRLMLRVLEQMHGVLHPHGDPDHEWDSETTEALSTLVYTIIPRPPDDEGAKEAFGYNLRELKARLAELRPASVTDERVTRLAATIDEFEEDLDHFSKANIIIPCMKLGEETEEEWLTNKLLLALIRNDGACLDNEAEREAVANDLALMLLGLAR